MTTGPSESLKPIQANATGSPGYCASPCAGVFWTPHPLPEVIMFRSMAGFKTQYHYLTLMVISEFNEWRVLLHSPTTAIHGTRQFSDAKAKEHAVAIAQKYIHEYKQEELPVL